MEDQQGKYKNGFLKEYNHWILTVSFRQHTLGCFIILAKNNIEKISDLEKEELIELKEVMDQIETALQKHPLFKPDRFNYLQLGNVLHRLHFHGIPRYASPRKFQGGNWIDMTWGKPPVWNKDDVSNDLVISIKKELIKYLA